MSTTVPDRYEPARPRVAVVLSGFGIERRGAESFVAELLPRLADRFDLHVYSRSGQGPGGVRRWGLRRQRTEPIYLSGKPVRKILDTLFLDPIHIEWTSHLLLSLPALIRGRYAVIWHETGLWGGWLLALVRRLTGARLLDVAHSSQLGWELPFARRRPDVYVSFTEALARDIRAQVPGLRVEVVPQPVDTEVFSPAAEPWPIETRRPVALMVGALEAEKAPLLAVEAVAATEASLVIAGDGPLAVAVDRLAASLLGPERYARLSLPREQMSRLYAAADVVVLTSPRESGPIVALEAMACGKPLVTAADPSRRALMEEAGVLVEAQTAEAYAAGIRKALAGEWAEVTRRRALDFGAERCAERFAALLGELAEVEA